MSNICDNDKQFLIDIAKKIKSKNLNIPSIFFLEMMRPLNFVGSQAMIFFGPIISAFVKTDGYYKAAEIFENHNSVEFLIQEIERLDKNE